MMEYYQKTCGRNSKSTKTKNYVTNHARYTMLKNHFLLFTLGRMTYENIKIKLGSKISILKP